MAQRLRDPALLLGQHRDLVVRPGLPHPVADLPVQVQSLTAQVTRLGQLAQPPERAAQVLVGVGLPGPVPQPPAAAIAIRWIATWSCQ